MNDDADELDPTELPSTEATVPSTGDRRQIGPYHLLQKLGEGGMGEVWEAEQEKPVKRRVALKIIKQGMDTKQVVARFEAERQALAMMDHPAVAKVFDAGATPEGRPYFAMECVRGVPITEHCDRHKLTNRERLELLMHVCDGVQHAHQKAIIHRDLKPSNVLVTIQDGKATPKIIDFGVAKATAQKLTDKTMFTALGVLIGTPEYMSPEQAEMTGQDVDTRTDVYSLGVILYELLAGALPFDSKALRSAGFDGIRQKIREEEPPRPSARLSTLGDRSTETAELRRVDLPTLQRQLRGDLDWITMKALEKDRTRRYGTPFELAADIERHLKHEPVLASPPSTVYRMRKFVRRHRLGVAAALLVTLALMTGMAGTAFGLARAKRAEAEAKREAATAEQVSEFLVDLFEVSDPSEAKGESITAREILDKGAERIDRSLVDQPRVQARLLDTMGQVHAKLGLLPRAETLLNQALDARRRVLGDEHPDTLTTMAHIAKIYYLQGRHTESEALSREILEKRRRVLGPEHPDTLMTMTDIGWQCWIGDRGDEGRSLTREALEVQRRVLGADHPDTLTSMHRWAGMLWDENEAEVIYREVLDGRRRVLGPEHAETLWTMQNLTVVLSNQGRYKEAAALSRERSEIVLRVMGEDHPDAIATLVNLAVGAQFLLRDEEAATLGEKALEKARSSLGENHRVTRVASSNLAWGYVVQGRYDYPERVFTETLEDRRRDLGEDHPRTLASAETLAALYERMGRLAEAEILYRDVLDRVGRTVGEDHLESRDALWGLGRVLLESGRRDEAEPHFRKALELEELASGEDGLWLDFLRARYHALHGERDEAIRLLELVSSKGFGQHFVAQQYDLDSLHGDPEFESIVARVRENQRR